MAGSDTSRKLISCVERIANEFASGKELIELAENHQEVEALAKDALTAVISVAVVRYVIARWRDGHATRLPEPLRVIDRCFSHGGTDDGQPIAPKVLEALHHPVVTTLTSPMQSATVRRAIADPQERFASSRCSDEVVLLVAYLVQRIAELRGDDFSAALDRLRGSLNRRDVEVLYEGETVGGRRVAGPRLVFLGETDEIHQTNEIPQDESQTGTSQSTETRVKVQPDPAAHSPTVEAAAASDRLRRLLPQFNTALADEIAASKGSRGQSYTLTQGRHVGERERQHIYSFDVEVQIHIPDESPIALRTRDQEVRGVLVASRDYVVVLALERDIGEQIPTATLLAEPWFLLEELQQRIAELMVGPYGKAEQLLRPDDVAPAKASVDVPGFSDLNEDQREAVRQIAGSEITYVWGPPGTGKTRTLGATVAALVDRAETVLVTAHSNVAVDVAMHSVLQWTPQAMHGSGEVVRFGPVYRNDLEGLKLITVEETVRRLHGDLVRELRDLREQERNLLERTRKERQAQRAWQQLEAVKERLAPIEARLDEVERELVTSAKVVGCTLSKAALAPEVIDRRFDAVLVDEVSMASIPACVYAASQAKRRAAVFGDFRQLSPIAISDSEASQRWLKRDVYQEAGIVNAVETGVYPNHLAALRTQYRMTSAICNLVNTLTYDGMLRTDEGLDEKLAPMVQLDPEPGRSVVVVDTERMKPYC